MAFGTHSIDTGDICEILRTHSTLKLAQPIENVLPSEMLPNSNLCSREK